VHAAAALDHQPADPAPGQVGGDPLEIDRVAAVDHGGDTAELAARGRQRRAGAVDQLVGVAEGEEPGRRVQLAAAGDGDLDRIGPRTAGHPGLAPGLVADQQARVVLAHRAGPDQDRVAGRPDLVDPVEVGVVGEQQPLALLCQFLSPQSFKNQRNDQLINYVPARCDGLGLSWRSTLERSSLLDR